MKLRHLIAATLFASTASLAWAVPADQRVRTMTNPDGTTVQVRVMGDEFFSFYTDADCTRILERDARGFFVDAVRGGMTLQLNSDNIQMLRDEHEAACPEIADTRRKALQRMATLDSQGRSNYPTIGSGNHSLVVLVEFSDQDFLESDPQAYYTRQLNERGFSDYGAKGSAIDYYTAISGGQYQPVFDVFGPVKLPNKASYYDNKKNQVKMEEFVRESLESLYESGEVDFSNYDLDEDGVLDTVFFYFAGHGQADSDVDAIWPHQYDYRYFQSYAPGYRNLKFDGKTMGPYACANELKGYNPTGGKDPWLDGIGTFVHEYGHVLGLPDLYDTAYDGVTVTPGDWDVMDRGCYNGWGCIPPLFSAYEQWVCRWLELEETSDNMHFEIPALGSSDAPKAMKIKLPKGFSDTTTEYFVIEARDNSGWDYCFPNSGIMIWHINYSKSAWVNNYVNYNKVSNVSIVYTKDGKNPIFDSGNIYEGGQVELTTFKNYSTWTHPFITSFAYDPVTKTGSFDYNVITEFPTGSTVLHDQPYADEDGSRGFTLSWDPAEDAESYQVTVRRVSNGSIIGDYDEFDVGKATMCHVGGLSLSNWVNEVEAYVRVVKNLPCAETSNVVRFVPKSLHKSSGVDDIVDDSVAISGGEGCVFAPADAEVFTMAGQKVGREGLPKGVYIVKSGAKTVKVIVK